MSADGELERELEKEGKLYARKAETEKE